MKPKVILSHIRTLYIRRLLYPLILLFAAVLILSRQPLFEFLNVTEVSASGSLSQAVNDRVEYAKTYARDLYYSGNDYYSEGSLVGHIYYQVTDSLCRFYILEPAAGKPAETYIAERAVTGRLEKIDGDTLELLNNLAETLSWSVDGLSGVCDPYLINEVVYFPASQKLLFILVALALLVGVCSMLYDLLLIAFPKLSRSVRRLSGYGDREEILLDANRELAESPILYRGSMTLTPKYLFDFSSDVSAIVPLESVLWVFDTQKLRFSLQERREKMVYTLRVVTISGHTFELRNKQKDDLDTIMEVLTDRYPNFFYGYSEEHDTMVHYILKENRRELRENRRSDR